VDIVSCSCGIGTATNSGASNFNGEQRSQTSNQKQMPVLLFCLFVLIYIAATSEDNEVLIPLSTV
jgi:hypothetical protein